MPGQRFQDPKIQTRRDVKRPYYFVRATVRRLGGTPERPELRLGFCDEMTMRQAQKKKQEVMTPINAGLFILQAQLPFSAIVERFLAEHVPNLGSAARERYPLQIRNHILPEFAESRLCDITRSAVESWLRGLERERPRAAVNAEVREEQKAWPSLSWWTRKDLLYILSGIFSRAIEWKLWDGHNPCDGVKIGPKKTKRVKRIPTKEDLKKFLDAIPETCIVTADGARLIVITAVVTGLRISEVLGLRRGDIDGETCTLHVERRWRRGDEADPKSEASRRRRELDSFARELLDYSWGKRPGESIFLRKDGEPLDDRDLQQHVFRPAAEAAGIYHEGFGMHVFRRLNVTWRQTIGGAAPVEAQKAAGHASLDMTMLYTQTEDDRERGQVEKILSHLGRKKSEEDLSEIPTAGPVQ